MSSTTMTDQSSLVPAPKAGHERDSSLSRHKVHKRPPPPKRYTSFTRSKNKSLGGVAKPSPKVITASSARRRRSSVTIFQAQLLSHNESKEAIPLEDSDTLFNLILHIPLPDGTIVDHKIIIDKSFDAYKITKTLCSEHHLNFSKVGEKIENEINRLVALERGSMCEFFSNELEETRSVALEAHNKQRSDNLELKKRLIQAKEIIESYNRRLQKYKEERGRPTSEEEEEVENRRLQQYKEDEDLGIIISKEEHAKQKQVAELESFAADYHQDYNVEEEATFNQAVLEMGVVTNQEELNQTTAAGPNLAARARDALDDSTKQKQATFNQAALGMEVVTNQQMLPNVSTSGNNQEAQTLPIEQRTVVQEKGGVTHAELRKERETFVKTLHEKEEILRKTIQEKEEACESVMEEKKALAMALHEKEEIHTKLQKLISRIVLWMCDMHISSTCSVTALYYIYIIGTWNI